ncbi:MAG TPA: hypothetical protein VFE47_22340 [Tepidisphaeraceae bacterium]|jgi:hypothetical protein|nr:hypothetical protein [Tepidisphaeraceae bacterium]
MIVALDASPLSLLTQRRGVSAADECRDWADAMGRAGHSIVVPAIADYETRRELLRAKKLPSVARLDAIRANPQVIYLPITDNALLRAATLWAEVRAKGLPTAAPAELDCDVVLVAILLCSTLPIDQIVVATTNPAHLSRFLPARSWQSILP